MNAVEDEKDAHRSSARVASVHWLLIVVAAEVVCALAFRLPALVGTRTFPGSGGPGAARGIVGLALIAVLVHAVWRVVRDVGHERVEAQRAAALMDTVLGISRDWLWVLDKDGCFTFSSPASREMVGYAPSELEGQTCSLVMDLSAVQAAEKHLRALNGQRTTESGFEVSCRHRNGTTTWLEVTVRPRRGPDGEIDGFEGASRRLVRAAEATAVARHTKARIEAVIAKDLLMIAYQPIVDLRTGHVIGAEALSRFVAEPAMTPDLWFQDATTVELGTELELYAVRAALNAAEALPKHIYVSVNLSPSACADPRVVPLMEQGPVCLSRIVLEVTEHERVDDYESLAASLAALRRAGVRLAIDDVTAGYASGRHILQLTPDLVKLDQLVVSGLDVDVSRRAMGSALVVMAQQIDATVIAEGIETAAQLAAAIELGMHSGQGYLLGRPTLDRAEWARWQEDSTVSPPFRS